MAASKAPTPARLVLMLVPAVVAAMVLVAGADIAIGRDDRSRGAGDPPNLSGLWQAMNTANWDIQDHAASAGPVPQLAAAFAVPPGRGVVIGKDIPYQPWALVQKQDNAQHWVERDPELKCYLPGVPRATYQPHPFQIVQSSGRDDILFAYEFDNAVRIVRMASDKRDPIDSWMGWSRGRWDRDTLVIDVTGFNDQTWFDRAGNFHSEALHVTERYTPLGHDVLQYEATIEDSKVFTRPWTIKMPLYRHLDEDAELLEFKCVEFAEELLYGPLSRPARTGASAGHTATGGGAQ